LAPSGHTMEVADIADLGQGRELAPIQHEGILDQATDGEVPLIQGDFGVKAEIEDGEIGDQVLTWGEAFFRAALGGGLAGHFFGPALFGGEASFFHGKQQEASAGKSDRERDRYATDFPPLPGRD